jgi:hypothetical protein
VREHRQELVLHAVRLTRFPEQQLLQRDRRDLGERADQLFVGRVERLAVGTIDHHQDADRPPIVAGQRH